MKRLIITSLLFLALSDAADVWISQVTNVQTEFGEVNPFARDAQHNFLLGRGIKVKLVADAAIVLVAGIVGLGLATIDRMVGAAVFAGILFYFAAQTVLGAVVPNFMIWLRWYTP